ncbi:short-chain dehydrogenase [Colletotrichum plurivorum]|uniref:Short-chain dehydrogenase n=1 Tax=Colletotrichum plurivorum TaxID=2175906 RepID=A0A8H6KJW9_9PEZI|nr:short-chain dehydrogenase [Colletotrichum plurivorum]
MTASKKLTVLITGCSPGGMGAALATTLHQAGHHVYATARNPSKLASLAEQGIRTLPLDVTDSSSIGSAVAVVSFSLPEGKGLDMLINNAAGSYSMPISDASLDAARSLFDVNVWAHVAVSQAFLPLLLKAAGGASAHATIVNHTSVGSMAALPFQGIYNASKAALAMLSETMRLELAAFNIRVVDLKTAGVSTNIVANSSYNAGGQRLPEGSIYEPAREVVEKAMSQEDLLTSGRTMPAEQWAEEVVRLLTGKSAPPAVIWKGEGAGMARGALMMPCNVMEGFLKKLTGLDVVEGIIREARR